MSIDHEFSSELAPTVDRNRLEHVLEADPIVDLDQVPPGGNPYEDEPQHFEMAEATLDLFPDIRPGDPARADEFATIVGRLHAIGWDVTDIDHLDVDDVVLPLSTFARLVNEVGAHIDPVLPDGRLSS